MSVPEDLFPFAPIPKETADHFSLTSWCKPILNDSSLYPFSFESRILKKDAEDTFTAITLQTLDTVPYYQALYSPPTSPRPFGEVLCLMSLGTHVNGHVDTAHGGFIAAMLDDMIGCVAESSRAENENTLTAYLNITYKKRIETPGVVLGRSWVERREGRKLFGKGTIENGEGVVLATGDALFIIVDMIRAGAKL